MGNCISFRESKKESVVPPNAEAVLQSSKSALPSNSKAVVPVEIDATTPSSTKSVIPSVNLSSASCFPNKDAQGTKNLPCKPVIHGDVEDFRQIANYENLIMFTYDELRLSTRNFRQDLIVGEGGFGLVYKGVLDENIRPGIKAMFVAIKDLNRDGLQGDREWLAEVNYLGQLSHPNLVKLIGYCCQDDHRLLVYEYMACGSLEKHLFQRIPQTISWTTRMKIALDVAKGLAFLHGAKRPIIYRDFKTSNILLDADYNAKLSDFGLAKEGPVGDKTHVSTRVMGTYGYAAPEYVMTGHLTARSDVYGFGVVLLEMLVGRRALDTSRPGREHNLVEWARPILIRCNKLSRIVDPRMSGQYSIKAAQRVSNLAYQCLSENPKGRPTMSEVVSALEGCLSANEHDAPQLHCERAAVAPERLLKRKENRRWMSDPPVDFDPRGASPETRFVNRVGDLTPDRYRQPHHA